MRKFILLFLLLTGNLAFAQQSCYDKANEFRNAKFNFDSVFIRIRQAQDMILQCEMPNDSFVNIKGNKNKIHNYKGKPTVINIWYLYYSPCINEIPTITAL